MIITIENYPKKYLEMIYTAGRNCYGIQDAAKTIEPVWFALKNFAQMLINKGHESVLEHICVSVYTKDASRSFLAQITRHRLVSYSVKSQHYVRHDDFKYKELENYGNWPHITLKGDFHALMAKTNAMYQRLINNGVPHYIAREVLPNACLTDIYMTANVREWRHIIKMRIGDENTPEIQEFAQVLLRELYLQMPELFEDMRDEYFPAGE